VRAGRWLRARGRGCGVKKLDSPERLLLVIAAGAVQTGRCVDVLLYRVLCWLVRALVRSGGERELEIVVLRHQLAILRRKAAAVRDRRSRAACSGQPSAPGRALVLLGGWPSDASPLAPDAARARPTWPPPSAWSSPACGRDAGPDRAAGAGEPELGLHAHRGRTAQARDQRLGYHDRDRVAQIGPRAGAAADRPQLVWLPPRPSAQHARRRCERCRGRGRRRS
jgi:hypothetical protein